MRLGLWRERSGGRTGVLLAALILGLSPQSAGAASAPVLGPISVRPAAVHIGHAFTLSGHLRGKVLFWPPLAILETMRTSVVHRNDAPICAGTFKLPVASTYFPGGGGQGAAKPAPPTGGAWHLRLTVPRTMIGLRANGASYHLSTPTGRYRVILIVAGMDGPCGDWPATNSAYIDQTTLTLVN